MKKKIVYLFLGVALGLLVGCGTSVYADSFIFKKNAGDTISTFGNWFNSVNDYIDTETGVHYLVVFDENSVNAICPRYKADGTLYMEE